MFNAPRFTDSDNAHLHREIITGVVIIVIANVLTLIIASRLKVKG